MNQKDNELNRSDQVEIQAKTAQEAIKIALAKLNAKKADVDIEILAEGNMGLFSMHGAKLAKIRVKKKLQKK